MQDAAHDGDRLFRVQNALECEGRTRTIRVTWRSTMPGTYLRSLTRDRAHHVAPHPSGRGRTARWNARRRSPASRGGEWNACDRRHARARPQVRVRQDASGAQGIGGAKCVLSPRAPVRQRTGPGVRRRRGHEVPSGVREDRGEGWMQRDRRRRRRRAARRPMCGPARPGAPTARAWRPARHAAAACSRRAAPGSRAWGASDRNRRAADAVAVCRPPQKQRLPAAPFDLRRTDTRGAAAIGKLRMATASPDRGPRTEIHEQRQRVQRLARRPGDERASAPIPPHPASGLVRSLIDPSNVRRGRRREPGLVGTGRSDILIGTDDDNQNDPEIRPRGSPPTRASTTPTC